jgi:hypothetical protein
MDYIYSHTCDGLYRIPQKIVSTEQEGFRADHSCDRAITHISLCVEDARSHKKDIVLCYLGFKGAFPYTNHKQLVRVLKFMGLPDDFTRLVSNLYSGASTKCIPPHGHTPPVGGAPAFNGLGSWN